MVARQLEQDQPAQDTLARSAAETRAPRSRLLELQRSAGNRAVGAMLARQSPAAAVRHPGATVFDAAYDLYALDGTDYDHATGRYFLSPWDRAHLRRLHGLYFIDTSLITPPEVRRAAGGRGVARGAAAGGHRRALTAAGRTGAARWVGELAQRRLGVTVASVTLSAGADHDWGRAALPGDVVRALGSPLEGVAADQAAGVEAARRRARRRRRSGH